MAVGAGDFSFRSSWISLFETARNEEPVVPGEDPVALFITCHQKKLFAEGIAVTDPSFEWLREKVEALSQSRISEGKGDRLQKVFDQIVAGRLKKVEKTLHPSKLKKVEVQFKEEQNREYVRGLQAWVCDPSTGGAKQEAADRILKARKFHLKDLRLDGLLLEGLPEELSELTWLENLYLENNQLETLPEYLGDFSHLQVLQLRENKLTSLPAWIWELKGTTAFDFSANRLTELPPIPEYRDDITSLRVSINDLSSLPAGIEYLTNLSVLDLRCNHFEELPSAVGQLRGLRELELWGGRLRSLPSEIGCLSQLRSLDLGRNQLEELPAELWDLFCLQRLYLNHNQLSHFPSPGDRAVQDLPWDLLDLSDNRFQELPDEIGELTNLTHLDLSANQLEVLPPEMRSRGRLRALNLDDNVDLHEIPLGWGSFPRLENFSWQNTAIPGRSVASLLDVSYARRWSYKSWMFPIQLLRWQGTASGLSSRLYDLEFLCSGSQRLSSSEKAQVSQWLHRLQATRDFRRNQARLADIVCSMLESLKDNEGFRESFFVQVGANLVCCQDRAAMSLNEIYTSWVLYTLGKEESFAKKVRLLLGVARTEALRKAVANTLSELGGFQAESVETFLYYETLLREELGLVSAIKGMDYGRCARREGISVEALKDTAIETHFKDFLELPQLKELLASDPLFEEQWHERVKQLTDELEDFEDQIDEEKRLQNAAEFCSFQQVFEKERASAVFQWIEGKLLDEESRLKEARQILSQEEDDVEQEELEVKMTAVEQGLEQIKSTRSLLSVAV